MPNTLSDITTEIPKNITVLYHVRVKVPISLQQQQCVYVLFSFSDFKKSIYFASVKLQIHQNEVLLV